MCLSYYIYFSNITSGFWNSIRNTISVIGSTLRHTVEINCTGTDCITTPAYSWTTSNAKWTMNNESEFSSNESVLKITNNVTQVKELNVTGNTTIGDTLDTQTLQVDLDATIDGEITMSSGISNINYGDGGGPDSLNFIGNAGAFNTVNFKSSTHSNIFQLKLISTASTFSTGEDLDFTSDNENIAFTAATAGKSITLTSPTINLAGNVDVTGNTTIGDTVDTQTLQVDLNATIDGEVVVNADSATQEGLVLRGIGMGPSSRGGLITYYRDATAIAGYTYINVNDVFVFDLAKQTAAGSQGLAGIDLNTGSFRASDGDFFLDGEGNIDNVGSITSDGNIINDGNTTLGDDNSDIVTINGNTNHTSGNITDVNTLFVSNISGNSDIGFLDNINTYGNNITTTNINATDTITAELITMLGDTLNLGDASTDDSSNIFFNGGSDTGFIAYNPGNDLMTFSQKVKFSAKTANTAQTTLDITTSISPTSSAQTFKQLEFTGNINSFSGNEDTDEITFIDNSIVVVNGGPQEYTGTIDLARNYNAKITDTKGRVTVAVGYDVESMGGGTQYAFRNQDSGVNYSFWSEGGDVALDGDNDKILTGEEQDREDYWDGTNAIINTTTGNLHIVDNTGDGNVKMGALNVTGKNATFEQDVTIKGTLHGGSPIKIAGGLIIDGGNVEINSSYNFTSGYYTILNEIGSYGDELLITAGGANNPRNICFNMKCGVWSYSSYSNISRSNI